MPGKYKQQAKEGFNSRPIKFSIPMAISLGILAMGLNIVPTPSYAETLQIPTAPKSYSVTLPGRGMTMTDVLEKFGEPQTKEPEVGEPPITRWDYPSYVVVFEYQYVIQSLTTNKPMGFMPPEAPATSEKTQPKPLENENNTSGK